jgi:lipopolysaccharide/colanic/teichoic acid biosynthesis glycosyltransferase
LRGTGLAGQPEVRAVLRVVELGVDAAAGARVRRIQPALKRTLDVLISAVVLALALPVMAVIALAIVIESPGGVLYRAERVGRNGRPLRMFKFRKMRRDAAGVPLTTAHDPRFTPVGALLARTKLDELPQLINVLRGDMSLIGPRPEDAAFVATRRLEFSEILTVRPGITGPSQIAFAQEARILSADDPVADYVERILPQKCRLDRMYVRSRSLRTDLRILIWTSAAVIGRRQVAVHRDTGRMSLRDRRR